MPRRGRKKRLLDAASRLELLLHAFDCRRYAAAAGCGPAEPAAVYCKGSGFPAVYAPAAREPFQQAKRTETRSVLFLLCMLFYASGSSLRTACRYCHSSTRIAACTSRPITITSVPCSAMFSSAETIDPMMDSQKHHLMRPAG